MTKNLIAITVVIIGLMTAAALAGCIGRKSTELSKSHEGLQEGGSEEEIHNNRSKEVGDKTELINGNLSIDTKKEWTFMFYDDADFSNAYNPLEDFRSRAFSGENLNVIVLEDQENGPATTWHVDEEHELHSLIEHGEINMGNYTTLRDFVSFSKLNFPAERYMLWLYDHGGAWGGACVDDTNGSDSLSMDEMQKALTESGGIDIICFSAPCLMGCIESAYELRTCTEIYIGSEELSGYIYWMDLPGSLCTILNDEKQMTNMEIGKWIVEEITKDANDMTYYPLRVLYTMSAIETKKTVDVAMAINQLSKNLIENIDVLYASLTTDRLSAEQYFLTQVDIIDFVENGYLLCLLNEHMKNVSEKTKQCIIAEGHGAGHVRSHGLSIYFPPQGIYSATYSNCGLDFANDTLWDEFLIEYTSLP